MAAAQGSGSGGAGRKSNCRAAVWRGDAAAGACALTLELSGAFHVLFLAGLRAGHGALRPLVKSPLEAVQVGLQALQVDARGGHHCFRLPA